jgi:hypothetical protein
MFSRKLENISMNPKMHLISFLKVGFLGPYYQNDLQMPLSPDHEIFALPRLSYQKIHQGNLILRKKWPVTEDELKRPHCLSLSRRIVYMSG